MTSSESNTDIKTSCAEIEKKQLNKYVHEIVSNTIQNLNLNKSGSEINSIECKVESVVDVPSSGSNTDIKVTCADIEKEQLKKYVHLVMSNTIQNLNESGRELNSTEFNVESIKDVPLLKYNTDLKKSKQLNEYVHEIVSNTIRNLDLNESGRELNTIESVDDVSSSESNIEKNQRNTFVQNFNSNELGRELNSIESEVESVEDVHTKMLIPLEGVNTFSIKINKQDKATGPGIIFSKDGKKVFNFDEKCPPVPYCDLLDLEVMSIPRTKIFVYPTRYILNDYNENGDLFPQVLGGGEVTRKVSFLDVLLVLAIQLIFTFSLTFICVHVHFLTNFMLYDTVLIYCVFGVGLTIYIALICYPNIRNCRPKNYIYLCIYSLCTGYLLGYVHVGYETNKLLLISLCETLIILLLIGFISWINIIDFTSFFMLIETLLTCVMVFYVIATVHMWLTGRTILMFIFFCILAPVVCLLILQQFQLLLGKGKYEIQTDEDVLISLHIYLEIIILFIVLPKFIIVTPT